MDIILKYFPNITDKQKESFSKLYDVYKEWNERINVISRKDFDHLYERHILHSLAIAKVIQFEPGTRIIDVGTGGGFPGIPLSIMFPECEFYLVDSIGKKIKVVNGVKEALGLTNVVAEHKNVKQVKEKYDFIVSRAVTAFPGFVDLVKHTVSNKSHNKLNNGIVYIKGGDMDEEIAPFKSKMSIWDIPDFFEEKFFETKKVLHLPLR